MEIVRYLLDVGADANSVDYVSKASSRRLHQSVFPSIGALLYLRQWGRATWI